jgi:hypothetical protein
MSGNIYTAARWDYDLASPDAVDVTRQWGRWPGLALSPSGGVDARG